MNSGTQVKDARLTTAQLRELATHAGPCLTLLLPEHRPGVPEGSRLSAVRALARSARELAAVRKLNIANFLEPVDEFADSLSRDEGGHGVALFRSPEFFMTANVGGVHQSRVRLGSRFDLAPLISPASLLHSFYILGLNRKRLRLFHYNDGRCEEVSLSENVALSMEMDRHDHDLQNRSGAGHSTGALNAVQFGTSSDRESSPEHLQHFFQRVDRELKGMIHGLPLVLAGVHEETASYRKVSQHNRILPTELQGNIDFLTPAQIAERATTLAEEHQKSAAEEALGKYREMPDRARTRSTVQSVLTAALAGRVHQLFAAEHAEIAGPVETQGWSEKEDLVNAAVVETLRHGGDVFMLAADRMPGATPLAAILRY